MTSAARDQLNFSHLPRYQKRQFVPEKANLTDRSEVEVLHNQLLERNISSTEDLTRLVLDRSELESSLDQEGSILYIRMTCKTDDSDRVKKYKDFIETIIGRERCKQIDIAERIGRSPEYLSSIKSGANLPSFSIFNFLVPLCLCGLSSQARRS